MCKLLCVFYYQKKYFFLDSFILFSIHKNRTSSSVRANHIRERVQCSSFRDEIHRTKIPTNCIQEIK